jgi:hypothetical protein
MRGVGVPPSWRDVFLRESQAIAETFLPLDSTKKSRGRDSRAICGGYRLSLAEVSSIAAAQRLPETNDVVL